MFFALSALYSGKIVREIEEGSFSFVKFYRRRFWRLYPSSLFTTAGVLATAMYVYSGELLVGTGESAVASSACVANMYFNAHDSYWDSGSELKPLLHNWSLSVEEQFYLIWPAVITIAARVMRMPSKMVWSIFFASVSLVSFMWTCRFESVNPTGAFFLLPARVYQLSCGAALMGVYDRVQRKQGFSVELISLSALLVCVLSFFMVSSGGMEQEASSLSSLRALPALVATLVLKALPRSFVCRYVLSHRSIAFLGSMTYTLYLVHWPIEVFVTFISYTNETLQRANLLTVKLLLTAVLGALQFWLVEKRFRPLGERQVSCQRWILMGIATNLVMTVAVFGVIWAGKNDAMLNFGSHHEMEAVQGIVANSTAGQHHDMHMGSLDALSTDLSTSQSHSSLGEHGELQRTHNISGHAASRDGENLSGAISIASKNEEADRKAKEEAERKAKEEVERKAKEEAERKAKEEAERKAKEEAERKAKEEAERKAKEEAERKAKEEAERKAKEEAERKAKGEAERKAKEEAERKAKGEAERKAKEEAERRAKEEAERKAKEEAERKAKEEAERKAKEEAERKAKEEADRKAKEEAEKKSKEEADRKAKEEAERKAKEEADRKAKEEATNNGGQAGGAQHGQAERAEYTGQDRRRLIQAMRNALRAYPEGKVNEHFPPKRWITDDDSEAQWADVRTALEEALPIPLWGALPRNELFSMLTNWNWIRQWARVVLWWCEMDEPAVRGADTIAGLRPCRVGSASASPRTLLIGDSEVGSIMPVFSYVGKQFDTAVWTISSVACRMGFASQLPDATDLQHNPPVPGAVPGTYACKLATLAARKAVDALPRNSLVIFHLKSNQLGSPGAMELYGEEVEYLRTRGLRIAWIGPLPWKKGPGKCQVRLWPPPGDCAEPAPENSYRDYVQSRKYIEDTLKVPYIDLADAFRVRPGSGENNFTWSADGAPLFRDELHINFYGALFAVNLIIDFFQRHVLL
ncbi:Titin-like [Porphyridium purpureum]|uniref:Titin-like n=1 Tax=Porphyridium purpureum TaxID=35688 RepID=A0A5J4YJT0_PORPP|nr:Titin-like [Porphyridium purpureum]|eukprot:POR9599..scf291_13